MPCPIISSIKLEEKIRENVFQKCKKKNAHIFHCVHLKTVHLKRCLYNFITLQMTRSMYEIPKQDTGFLTLVWPSPRDMCH